MKPPRLPPSHCSPASSTPLPQAAPPPVVVVLVDPPEVVVVVDMPVVPVVSDEEVVLVPALSVAEPLEASVVLDDDDDDDELEPAEAEAEAPPLREVVPSSSAQPRSAKESRMAGMVRQAMTLPFSRRPARRSRTERAARLPYTHNPR